MIRSLEKEDFMTLRKMKSMKANGLMIRETEKV